MFLAESEEEEKGMEVEQGEGILCHVDYIYMRVKRRVKLMQRPCKQIKTLY